MMDAVVWVKAASTFYFLKVVFRFSNKKSVSVITSIGINLPEFKIQIQHFGSNNKQRVILPSRVAIEGSWET